MEHYGPLKDGNLLDCRETKAPFKSVLHRNKLNIVTEELRNPAVNLPRALMIGIPLVCLCYLSVNVAYLTVLSPQAIIQSPAVAVVSRLLTIFLYYI